MLAFEGFAKKCLTKGMPPLRKGCKAQGYRWRFMANMTIQSAERSRGGRATSLLSAMFQPAKGPRFDDLRSTWKTWL